MTGELALGQLSNRREIVALLARLPAAPVATPPEPHAYLGRHRTRGSNPRDERLAARAADLGLAVEPARVAR